jgi:hypothetical protein
MRNLFTTTLITLSLSTAMAAAKIEAGKYNVDPMHSKVGFEVPHLVISTVEGKFKTFTGTLVLDEKIEKSKLNAEVDIASIDTSVDDRDKHLKSPDFFDAAKYPSVAWDSITFECGVGGPANTYEVRLLDHATVLSGSETPAALTFAITGAKPIAGTDTLHLHFRDTRYTATSAEASDTASLLQRFANLVNTPGDTVAGRYGPDQSGVIEASIDAGGNLRIAFKSLDAPTANYGKLGNLDVILTTAANTDSAQGFSWDAPTHRFFGGGLRQDVRCKPRLRAPDR